MPSSSHIKTIVDLITNGQYLQATEQWLSQKKDSEKCSPCFYEPLDPKVRCAACLEGHLGNAALKRAYPSVGQDQLVLAKQQLDAWIRDQR